MIKLLDIKVKQTTNEVLTTNQPKVNAVETILTTFPVHSLQLTLTQNEAADTLTLHNIYSGDKILSLSADDNHLKDQLQKMHTAITRFITSSSSNLALLDCTNASKITFQRLDTFQPVFDDNIELHSINHRYLRT